MVSVAAAWKPPGVFSGAAVTWDGCRRAYPFLPATWPERGGGIGALAVAGWEAETVSGFSGGLCGPLWRRMGVERYGSAGRGARPPRKGVQAGCGATRARYLVYTAFASLVRALAVAAFEKKGDHTWKLASTI